MANDVAGRLVKEELNKVFLEMKQDHSNYKQLYEQISKNSAELVVIKGQQIAKIQEYFKSLKQQIDKRERTFIN